MAVFTIVVLLAVGVVFAMVLGSLLELAKKDESATAILCLVLIVVFTGMGACRAYEYGKGKLCTFRLKSNAIYETLSSTSDGAEKYAVILKEQDGSLSAYVLAQDPPKMFKVKNLANGDQMLEPFPPVSPAPSVPSKK